MQWGSKLSRSDTSVLKVLFFHIRGMLWLLYIFVSELKKPAYVQRHSFTNCFTCCSAELCNSKLAAWLPHSSTEKNQLRFYIVYLKLIYKTIVH